MYLAGLSTIMAVQDVTPKVIRKPSMKQLKPPTPADPNLASPETRRRAAEIRLKVTFFSYFLPPSLPLSSPLLPLPSPQLSPPPDAEASEEAVKSIIGEVFNDISFEEFERRSVSVRNSLFYSLSLHNMILCSL